MIKQYIDNYIKQHVDACFAIKSTKLLDAVNGLVTGIKSDIEQKDQRITDLIEQTKNQIIERMVSTEIKSKGKIKEISKQEIISMIFRRNPQELFSPKQIHETLGCNKKHEKGYVSLLLQNLIKKGLIKKVKHGLYQYDKGW